MTHSIADAGKRVIVTVVAVITAGILVMGCATPAYAKSDNGWGEEGYTDQGQNTQGLPQTTVRTMETGRPMEMARRR